MADPRIDPEGAVAVVRDLEALARIIKERYGPEGADLERHLMWAASAVWAYAYPGDSDELEGVAQAAYNVGG